MLERLKRLFRRKQPRSYVSNRVYSGVRPVSRDRRDYLASKTNEVHVYGDPVTPMDTLVLTSLMMDAQAPYVAPVYPQYDYTPPPCDVAVPSYDPGSSLCAPSYDPGPSYDCSPSYDPGSSSCSVDTGSSW
jgi:hypothetical protein